MRSYCSNCHYPESNCICEAVAHIESPINIIVLQHPKEVGHAKNTVKLMRLCLPDMQVVVGKSACDFTEVQRSIDPQTTALVYPTKNSHAFESFNQQKRTKRDTLIFIDASWRQAYAIWKSAPWLQDIPQFHFDNAPESRYQIRHTKIAHSLSTLEATAYALEVGFEVNTQALLDLQVAMQANWQGPKAHYRNRNGLTE